MITLSYEIEFEIEFETERAEPANGVPAYLGITQMLIGGEPLPYNIIIKIQEQLARKGIYIHDDIRQELKAEAENKETERLIEDALKRR